MYFCEICNKEVFKKNSLKGYKSLCTKHFHQILKYGHPLDNNPRTQKDLNNIIIEGDIAKIELYGGPSSDIIGYCIIDSEDIEKIKYHKCRISHGHVIIVNRQTRKDIGHVILNNQNKSLVIDHINGNPYDNRKSNLRLCKQRENTYNRKESSNKTGFIGITLDKRKGRTKQ